MSKKINEYSTLKAIKRNNKGRVIDILYLCDRDEENGTDAQLDMLGYEIIVL